MALVPTGHIKTIDDARRAIQKLASNKLGPNASPTYYGLTLTTPLTVPNGGTGLATLTDHGILLGSGTGVITPLAEATDGQIPIGDTDADPVLATITGTANRVTVSNAAGSITLSGPQDYHTGASPIFVNGTFTGKVTIAGLHLAIATKTNANYTLTANDDVILFSTGNTTRTATLPAASTVSGKVYHIKKIDLGTGFVIIDGNGSETIDGAITAVITVQYESITIQSDGSNWHIL